MGKQISLYLYNSDFDEFESIALGLESALILHQRSEVPFTRRLESTDLVEDGQRQCFFYFLRSDDRDSVITQAVPAFHHWAIDQMCSPVVEYIRGEAKENVLRPSRLWYSDSYYQEGEGIVRKSSEFCEWAKRFFAKTRGSFEYNQDAKAYMGRYASKALGDGFKLGLY